MEILAKLKDQGWYLTEDGIKKLPEDVDKSDTRKIIQAAMDMDFREIAGGALPTDFSKKGETVPGRIVLQISKIRNIAAPKANEESTYAPRLFHLDLTDGVNQMPAIELEHISALNFNTPPGTKIFLKSEKVQLVQGMLMLKPSDIQVLGGVVVNLVEKWVMSRDLLKYAKGGRVMNGGSSGPPPWTAFGKSIQQQNVNIGNDKNFKSLAVANEKEGKENNEFDAMRNEAIAEAAKAGSKKVFGGGNQQIVDHNVKKILEKGYTEEDAKNALRATRNNLEKALFNLKRREEYKNKDDSKSSGYDKSKSTVLNDRNSSTNKRGANTNIRESFSNKKNINDDLVPTKPAGNVSLFDFLTDKLPSNPVETEKPPSKPSQNPSKYSSSSTSVQQTQQSSRYESKNERSSRTVDSYNSSNSKSSYYNNNNNSNSQQQQSSSSYSDSRNQNHQQNQHHIPNSHTNRGSMNQKFENNLSSSFQANRNYSQDNERPRNRNNRESVERAGSSNNTGSNRNYQNSYQGRGGSSGNDRQYEEQNSDRYYNNREQRNNYNQRNSKSQQGNERESGSRSGNDRSSYQGSSTSHYQYHHQNNSSNYDNRNNRNDNQSYRNGYDNSRSGGSSGNYQNNKGSHSQMSSSRYSQKDNSSNYQQNHSQNQGSNNSRNYSDNRQQSYHQQQSNQNTEAKINKIIEDTSKLKLDQQNQQQQQQSQSIQQHSQKPRLNQNNSSHRNQNQHQSYQQQSQQQHLATQHQPQIMTVVSHPGPPPNQSMVQQHAVQTNQAQPHPHFQPPPQVHTAQHSLQTGAFTQLPNGYAYDPNKIMGFQNKESNDFAMTLLKSQGIPTALTPTNALAPPQPPHPHPSVTPNAVPQSTTPHPAYPTMQIGHPPPPTMGQHTFAAAGPTFVMQPTSIAPPPQLATINSQVGHPHTPVGGIPQQQTAYGMNPGETWNWKIGDRCLAKYWDDARFYEAEITGISDKTCVVFYLGYGNHEEVVKSDCLPITDAQNRAINFGGSQAATVVAIQQQQQPPPTAVQLSGVSRGGLPNRYRGDRQMYVPPPKRDG